MTLSVIVRKGSRVVVTEEIARAWIDMISARADVQVLVLGEVIVYEDGAEPPIEPVR